MRRTLARLLFALSWRLYRLARRLVAPPGAVVPQHARSPTLVELGRLRSLPPTKEE